MSNITIFEESSNLPTVRRESRRMDRMVSGSGTSLRRIALSNGRTFKRVVGGEQIGKSVQNQLEVIIVDWMPEPSRKFYIGAYDPNAKATLPDCWANDGVTPEAGAKNPQQKSCATCPKNVKGSGSNGKGKACRYERRLAILIAGDPSGDVYQISIPGASLFADAEGNAHGFEGYRKFLMANNEAFDTVVTRIIYDTEADTAKVRFKATRHLTEVESGLVDLAQDSPETERYIKLTVGAVDGAADPEPQAAKTITLEAKPQEPAANPFGDDEDEDEVVEVVEVVEVAPTKRASKPKATVDVKPELVDALKGFLDDEED